MIAQIVPPQAFEIVRDRIAQVLNDEFQNQATLMNTAVPNSGIYLASTVVDVELKKPVDKTEVPTVIVSVIEDTFSDKDQRSMKGLVSYAVDVYTSGKQTGNIPGDKVSGLRLQKMLGLIRYILSDAIYKTLLFAPGVIGGTMVNGFQIRANDPNDADNTSMARLAFGVIVLEQNTLLAAPMVSGTQTTTTFDNTSIGYVIEQTF